ncbi:MAG TPA: magnesium chelatase [Elusimicrobia bacterium]|nr:magnesium chelatase [Elusimicrobiota bacterium]
MKKRVQEIIDGVEAIYVGKRPVVEKLLTAILANGHVLLEDVPGTGKTLLTKLIAQLCGMGYKRVQGTAELLPSDILGGEVWDMSSQSFRLVKGPVFTNIFLFDEINRVPPKTLSALLEVSEERQVTIGGESLKMARPFFLMATQNPTEFEGTWVLPEAQVDRFLMRISTGYPRTIEDENALLKRRIQWQSDDPSSLLKPLLDAESLAGMQAHIEKNVHVGSEIIHYISTIVRATREHPKIALGASPRGSLALLKASRAYAFIQGRDFVIPDDVTYCAIDCLNHRVTIKMDFEVEGVRSHSIIGEILGSVPVPRERTTRPEARDGGV